MFVDRNHVIGYRTREQSVYGLTADKDYILLDLSAHKLDYLEQGTKFQYK